VLVTRNWYIRALDPRTASYTGLTRDGTFLVENGRITRSIRNFRWNESPLLMLNRIIDIGRAERVDVGRVMPSLKIRDFNFASISEAV
jgi:predicted Zn-dependent protease